MTKPITATAIMMLQDEGKLNIDDPVMKYLPEFKGQMLVKKDGRANRAREAGPCHHDQERPPHPRADW